VNLGHLRDAKSRSLVATTLLICAMAAICGSAVPVSAARSAQQTGAASQVATESGLTPAEAPYVLGEVLIGWEPGSSGVPKGSAPKGFREDRGDSAWQMAASLLSDRTGLGVLEVHPYYGTARLAVSPGQEPAEVQRLAQLPWVAYAEPNYIAKAAGDLVHYPNDPYIGDEWNMRRIGAPEAWEVWNGVASRYPIVAVLDTGIDSTHPEFAGRVLFGYDFVNGDNYPDDDNVYSHGTHVAGILAAAADNRVGVAGLAPKVLILPLKVLDANGQGTHANIATAIRLATDRYAQVINLSLESTAADNTLHDAVIYAAQRGVLVVAAAGNFAEVGNPSSYPAAYPEVLAVAASDHYDNWAPYSGHKSYVALAAPGGISAGSQPDWAEYEIRSTVRMVQGGYGFLYGTSMATPLVSAAAALVWDVMPDAAPTEVAQILESTADKIGTDPQTGTPIPYVNGRNDYFGYGRLNAARAVRWAYPPSLSPNSAQQGFMLGGSLSQRSRQSLIVNPSERSVSWEARVTAGDAWLHISPTTGTAAFSAPASLTLKAGPTTLGPGYYQGTVEVRTTAQQPPSSYQIGVSLLIGAEISQVHMPAFGKQVSFGSWIDPLVGGQPLHLINNSARLLDLPFAVSFYGRLYHQVWVSDDGLVSFAERYMGPAYSRPTCLPTAVGPNNAIYALWEDLNPGLGGEVYAQQVDAGRFVITWYKVPRSDGTTPQSFQIVFSSSGLLRLQYASVDSAGQATIGIENHDGTVSEQILCHGSGRQVWDGDVISLTPDLPW
jgi:hypothetical protein